MERIKCTVLIPTYNRPNHLKRILGYYNQYVSGLPIVIADSSSDENKKLNKETVASFCCASFLYLDKYDTSANFCHKICNALQHVSDQYCVLCADDDFVTLSGLREAVDFLEANPDFTTAFGRREGFLIELGRENGPRISYLKYRSQSNRHPDARHRLIRELSNYDGTSFYAVRRTDFTRMLYANVLTFTDSDIFAELIIIGLSCIYGKMNCIDKLFLVREACTPGHLTQRHILLRDLMKDQNYIDKKKRYLYFLAGHLSKRTGIDIGESQDIVDIALSAFASKSSSLSDRMNVLLTDLRLPQWLDNSVRKLYGAVALAFAPSEKAYSLTAQYHSDMSQITDCILSNVRETYVSGSHN